MEAPQQPQPQPQQQMQAQPQRQMQAKHVRRFRSKSSEKSQFFRAQQQDEERNSLKLRGKVKEYGDASFVCFRVKDLEFFCPADLFAAQSAYFERVRDALDMRHDAEEFKEEKEITKQQLVVRLKPRTKPSVLLRVIAFVRGEFELSEDLDLHACFELLAVADQLKMRALEKRLICAVIMPQINQHNVLDFLNVGPRRACQKRARYREITVEASRDGGEASPAGREEAHSDSEDFSDCEEEEKDEAEIEKVQIDLPYDKHESIDELKQSEANWQELADYSFSVAAQHLGFIMEHRADEFVAKVRPENAQAVVSRAIKFFRGHPAYENRQLIELMLRVRKVHSVFELLRLEKERAIKEELEQREQLASVDQQRAPLLVWSVNNLTNFFYKQSDSVHIEGANWRLALSYFKKQSADLKVELKVMNSPFDTKQAKDYFKKGDFSVPANLDVQKLDPLAQFEVEDVEIAHQQRRVNQLNATAAHYSNHALVSFVASVDLFRDKQATPPQLHTMICSQKAPVLLHAVKNFSLEAMEHPEIDVSLHFTIREEYSQLLTYVSKNFSMLAYDPEIRLLSKDELKLLLKHKHLGVAQEDEVLKAVCLWTEGQLLMMRHLSLAKVPNPTQRQWALLESAESMMLDGLAVGAHELREQEMRNFREDLNEVLQNVNWDFVSLPCLLDVLRTDPVLRQAEAFQKAVRAQLKVRFDRSSPEAIQEAETAFNCEPRFSYKFNTSQRNLYPNEEELVYRKQEMVAAESGAKNQFQLLYPVYLYPDFLAHLADCLFNPIDIVKTAASHNLFASPLAGPALSSKEQAARQKDLKRRHLKQQLHKKRLEMTQLEDQLAAMELLDSIAEEKPAAQSFAKMEEQLAKAKQMFQMRVASLEEGQPSSRRHHVDASESSSCDELSDMDEHDVRPLGLARPAEEAKAAGPLPRQRDQGRGQDRQQDRQESHSEESRDSGIDYAQLQANRRGWDSEQDSPEEEKQLPEEEEKAEPAVQMQLHKEEQKQPPRAKSPDMPRSKWDILDEEQEWLDREEESYEDSKKDIANSLPAEASVDVSLDNQIQFHLNRSIEKGGEFVENDRHARLNQSGDHLANHKMNRLELKVEKQLEGRQKRELQMHSLNPPSPKLITCDKDVQTDMAAGAETSEEGTQTDLTNLVLENLMQQLEERGKILDLARASQEQLNLIRSKQFITQDSQTEEILKPAVETAHAEVQCRLLPKHLTPLTQTSIESLAVEPRGREFVHQETQCIVLTVDTASQMDKEPMLQQSRSIQFQEPKLPPRLLLNDEVGELDPSQASSGRNIISSSKESARQPAGKRVPQQIMLDEPSLSDADDRQLDAQHMSTKSITIDESMSVNQDEGKTSSVQEDSVQRDIKISSVRVNDFVSNCAQLKKLTSDVFSKISVAPVSSMASGALHPSPYLMSQMPRSANQLLLSQQSKQDLEDSCSEKVQFVSNQGNTVKPEGLSERESMDAQQVLRDFLQVDHGSIQFSSVPHSAQAKDSRSKLVKKPARSAQKTRLQETRTVATDRTKKPIALSNRAKTPKQPVQRPTSKKKERFAPLIKQNLVYNVTTGFQTRESSINKSGTKKANSVHQHSHQISLPSSAEPRFDLLNFISPQDGKPPTSVAPPKKTLANRPLSYIPSTPQPQMAPVPTKTSKEALSQQQRPLEQPLKIVMEQVIPENSMQSSSLQGLAHKANIVAQPEEVLEQIKPVRGVRHRPQSVIPHMCAKMSNMQLQNMVTDRFDCIFNTIHDDEEKKFATSENLGEEIKDLGQPLSSQDRDGDFYLPQHSSQLTNKYRQSSTIGKSSLTVNQSGKQEGLGQRDHGLACFNLLDHLRAGQPTEPHQKGPAQKVQLDDLREQCIRNEKRRYDTGSSKNSRYQC